MTRQGQRRSALIARAAPLVVTATVGTAGCGAPIAKLSSEVPKNAAPATIRATVDTLRDPALQKEIARILTSPEMGEAQHELAAGITGGALDAALAPERQPAMQRAAGAVVATSVRAATDGLDRAGIGARVAAGMTERFGPALETTMRDDLAPGLASVAGHEELQRSLGATARVIGREIVLGATDALAQQKAPPETDSLLGRISGLARQGATLFGSAAWLLILVIALLFAWIVKLLAQARRYRSDASRRVAAAQLLEEAAKAAEGKPWAGELIRSLQERAQAEEKALAGRRGARHRAGGPTRERHA
jgi:hypothetical protein